MTGTTLHYNYRCMAKGYFHVSSHGLEKNDIFKNKEDFIRGMNDIAISALGYDVCILAFCLMSNHFHFVLYGTLEECTIFAEEYKRRCGMRMRCSSGEVKGLKDVCVQIDKIDSQEYLENAIAYVLRNPLAAGILMMPYHYKWSSISIYFRGACQEEGTKLNDLSVRKRVNILRSHQIVPDAYMIDADGMILPSCYVNFAMVEKIFRHPARLMASLSRKVENDMEVRLGVADSVSITDQELMTQMNELIRLEFGHSSLYQLSVEEKVKLCLSLKRNFGVGVKQIARVTRLNPEIVAKVV